MNRAFHIVQQIVLSTCVVWIAGGATCFQRRTINDFEPPPEIFDGVPSREEIASAINRTDQIQKLQSNSASIEVLTMPALPSLRANLALQRPHRFRMRASLPVIMGSGMDLGSNEELFWMRVPEGMGTSLYYARHAEYRRQLQKAVLPVDPTWIIDALGLMRIDPALIAEGPISRDDGQLELKLNQPMVDGLYRRVLVVDGVRGVVTEQLLYGPSGRLLASATGEDFRYLKDVQCSLPHLVQLRITPTGGEPLALKIEVGSYSVNELLSEDPRLFAMPHEGNERAIDLSRLSPPGGPPAAAPPEQTGFVPQIQYVPQTAARTPYRGVYR